jgi:tight adherence protein B
MTVAVLASLLLGLAVVVWPAEDRLVRVNHVLAPPPAFGETGREGRSEALRQLWRSDPVELFREWRQQRRATSSLPEVLAMLEGIAPALEAGLPPAVAVRLSGAALGSALGSATQPFVGELLDACERGSPIAPVWQEWAERTGSTDLAFVGAAWRLSELTGAPLAEAVHRAVVSVRESREQARRVNVAVAGPRATVLVLTVLPLTGPVFGLACGVPPAELYLSGPIGSASAVLGVVLIWAGRLWCRRLIESAMRGSGAAPRVGRRS